VIRGANSDLLSAATVERMVREKPGLEQVTVANRGHTPLLNEPECVAALDAFIARHGDIAKPGSQGHAPQ
jgi:pimeloyl-ACP methyl ester carboxylesterase